MGIAGSLIIMFVGAVLLTKDGADAATFGWLLLFVGALALVANLFVGARMR